MSDGRVMRPTADVADTPNAANCPAEGAVNILTWAGPTGVGIAVGGGDAEMALIPPLPVPPQAVSARAAVP